jgi:farnesyl-diphosphate farnesyltransferase
MKRMDDLLVKTSRTFALAIPFLPEPTRTTTCLAYLLFRIADTLEDASLWPYAMRLEALEKLSRLLASPSAADAEALHLEWVARPPTAHAGYRELIEAMPELFREVDQLDPTPKRLVLEHVSRTVEGMRAVVLRASERGVLSLATIEELQSYCYVVAGIVGELLTCLFVHDTPSLAAVEDILTEHGAAFGEALQLVNILKDAADDSREGRTYVPQGVLRTEIFALARRDVRSARQYIEALQRGGAAPGTLVFTSFAVDLADATLDGIEADSANVKVPRSLVASTLARLQEHFGLAPPRAERL